MLSKSQAIFAILFISSTGLFTPNLTFAGAKGCGPALSQISKVSANSTEAYINLLRTLIENKNAVEVQDLNTLLSQTRPISPFDIVTVRLPSVETFAFKDAFERLIKKQSERPLDWKRIKIELKKLLGEKSSSDVKRKAAKDKTAALFVPITLDEVKNRPETIVDHTFKLSDDSWAVIYTVGEKKTYLYDTKTKNQILLGRDDGGHQFYHYNLSSGNILLTYEGLRKKMVDGVGEVDARILDIYEITPQHEFKIFKGDFKNAPPGNDLIRPILWETYPTESPAGKPAILEALFKVKKSEKDGIVFHDVPVIGYLEIEIGTGNQRFIPLPEDKDAKVIISSKGHVVSYKLNSKVLVAQDLSTGSTIAKIPLPEIFRSNFKRFLPESEYGIDEILEENDLLLKHYSITENNKFRSARWIDLKTAAATDLTPHLKKNMAMVLIKKGRDFRIMVGPDSNGSVLIYDQVKEKIIPYKLPPDMDDFLAAKVLKLQNGKSILFVLSGESEQTNSLAWLDLNDGQSFSKMDLRGSYVRALKDVHETKSGAIEGLFETESGFKVIQIYGPVPH